jgi:60 kDa SS-A/Ro ribonucleoprotein
MTELLAYLDGKLPKQVKRGLRHSLLKFDRYQLSKYRGENKKYKLVDIFNLIHPDPKFASDEQRQAWSDLINGKLISHNTWESVISTTKDKKSAWEGLIAENKLGYMAMLRNLNNFIKENIDEKYLDMVVAKLTDPEQVRKSKQLPFRFMTAYKNVNANRKLTDAISIAMDLSVSNMPEYDGKTLVAIDSSGSMEEQPFEIASIFGCAMFRGNSNADMILYDTEYREVNMTSRTPIIDMVDKLGGIYMGGGTETSQVFKYALDNKKLYDRIIILSDNESWSETYFGGFGVNEMYNEYKKITGTDPFVYAIDIQGYGTKDVTGGKVSHITGWSNRLLDFIPLNEKQGGLIDYINSIEL